MKKYTEQEKRFIRIGYYRQHKEGMPEEKFRELSSSALAELLHDGSRKLSLRERVKDSLGSIIGVTILVLIFAYTIVTFIVWNADYNKIAKVDACSLLKGLDLPQALPDQVVSIEETGNVLGAATDCWVRIKSGQTELVAIAYVYPEYAKKYPKTSIATSDWRGTLAQEFSFEDNFYRGTVTVYQKSTETNLRDTEQTVLERDIANDIGKHLTSKLPKNENLESVRRGVVWGWLVPTFFEDEVQGSPPKAP